MEKNESVLLRAARDLLAHHDNGDAYVLDMERLRMAVDVEERKQDTQGVLLRACAMLVREFTHGERNINPYSRQPVRDALRIIARLQGKMGWADADVDAVLGDNS